MLDLRNLSALCPPPAEPVRPGAPPAEGTVRDIPDSHRQLIATYGLGRFDAFLWIYGAGVSDPRLDIAATTEATRSLLRNEKIPDIRAELSEYGLEPDDLVQWGGTENADALLWLPVGDPDDWPTLVIEAGQRDFAVLYRGSPGVLLDLLTGLTEVRFFPESFPSDHPEFSAGPAA